MYWRTDVDNNEIFKDSLEILSIKNENGGVALSGLRTFDYLPWVELNLIKWVINTCTCYSAVEVKKSLDIVVARTECTTKNSLVCVSVHRSKCPLGSMKNGDTDGEKTEKDDNDVIPEVHWVTCAYMPWHHTFSLP